VAGGADVRGGRPALALHRPGAVRAEPHRAAAGALGPPRLPLPPLPGGVRPAGQHSPVALVTSL
jgi:hypothetical protein